MIHTINTLTIRKYSLFDVTNKAKYLKRFPLPNFLYKKKIEELVNEISDKLSNTELDDNNLTMEEFRLNSIYKIQILTGLYNGIYNLLINQLKINNWNKILKLQSLASKNLKEYIEKVERYTEIRIKSTKDLTRLKKEIERRVDKYLESFPKKNDNKDMEDGVTFQQIVLGVCSIMNMPLNYDMTISYFIDQKNLAEKKIKLNDNNSIE